jgi:hypothetical protein
MERLCNFQEYVSLRDGGKTQVTISEDFRAKTSLYPLGYGGIGLYPLSWYMPYSADAVLYVTQDERLYCNGDKAPFDISHIPGHKQFGDRINNGESKPFDLSKIPGKPTQPKYKLPPGNVVAPKSFVKLVTNIKSYIDKNPPKLPPE